MTAMLFRSWLGFLSMLLLLTPAMADAQNRVQEIKLHTAWGGLGTPKSEVIIIGRQNGRLVYNGKMVNQSNVDTLVVSLKSPLMPKPDVSNLGVTPAWLSEQMGDRKGPFKLEAASGTASQRMLLSNAFTDPQQIASTVPELFAYIQTDDYPSATIDITFDDGSKLAAETNSYYPFMLPWAVSEKTAVTYNADISRALAKLLGPASPNKGRLAGEGFADELVRATKRSIEPQWNLLGSKDRAADALTMLERSYEVLAADIHPYHHPEYGTATYKGEREEVNLHASLRKSALPPSVTVSLVLRQNQGRVEGVEDFLANSPQYESLALSVPWLNQFIQEHPRIPVRISYVHDRSVGEKAMRTFKSDMEFRERSDLIEQVRAQQSQIVLLIVGNLYSESYWLLFPDKHMVLWRYGGPSGLLKWSASDFPAGECAEYKQNFGGCSGREVTAEGILGVERTPRDQVCMAANRASRPGSPQNEPLFPVEDRGRGGFIDHSGQVVIPLCFDAVGDFSEGLARFERDKKWGYIDTTGAVIIEPKFPWAQEFSEGLARVQIAGSQLGIDAKWGFIDTNGSVVIDVQKDASFGTHSNIGSDSSEGAFHDGLAIVDVGEKHGYIDKTGRIAIPIDFTYAYPFSEGVAAVTKSQSGNDGWGYIDKKGKWVIEPKFQWASSFSNGLAPVNRTRNCGYIDTSGAMVLQPAMSSAETDCATVWGDFIEGLSRWKFGKKYGYIDHAGKTVIKPQYDLTYHFSEGLAAVLVGGNWGYINTSGEMVISPMPLKSAEDFHHGLALVSTKDGKYGYINKSGKYVWMPTLLYRN